MAAAAVVLGLVAADPALAGKGNGKPKGHSDRGESEAPQTPSTPGVCALSDLSIEASACSGFFQGNLLNDSPSDRSAQADALAALGFSDWDGSISEPQLDLTSQLVDFSTLLSGATWIGIHWGAGTGSPSPQTPGGVTGFYRIDAGSGLDTFLLSFGSASGARLYATQPQPVLRAFDPIQDISRAVPEPAAWALMILGFGAVGATLRRRRALAA